jgi:signal transduction histidine kinase
VQLAEDLLLLARVDEGTLPIRRQDVRVDELLNGIARRFERRAREEGRAIEVSANGAHLNVDRLRVEQALGNLVENALRYGEGTIGLAGDTQTLRVSDEGAGFPPGFALVEHRLHTRTCCSSCDSRTWGTVGRSSLVGKVVATYRPPFRIRV